MTGDDEPRAARRELASALRRLRRENGFSQRALAVALNFGSHSSIADMEAGKRIPSLDVVAAYERYFELPVDSPLRELRRRALAEEVATEEAAGEQPGPALSAGAAPAPTSRSRRAIGWLRRRVAYVAAGVLVAAGCGYLLWDRSAAAAHRANGWYADNQNVTDHGELGGAPEPMDGDDPRARGCYPDATTLHEVPLYLPDHTQFGTLRLRHSSVCGTNWASAYYQNPNLYKVTLVAHRPVDNAIMPSDWAANTPPGSYGDMLSTATGCVYVEGWVQTPAGTGPVARTDCLSG